MLDLSEALGVFSSVSSFSRKPFSFDMMRLVVILGEHWWYCWLKTCKQIQLGAFIEAGSLG